MFYTKNICAPSEWTGNFSLYDSHLGWPITFRKFDFILRIPPNTIQLNFEIDAQTYGCYPCKPRLSCSHRFFNHGAPYAEITLVNSSIVNTTDALHHLLADVSSCIVQGCLSNIGLYRCA